MQSTVERGRFGALIPEGSQKVAGGRVFATPGLVRVKCEHPGGVPQDEEIEL